MELEVAEERRRPQAPRRLQWVRRVPLVAMTRDQGGGIGLGADVVQRRQTEVIYLKSDF
jgi:hypothetical protein